MGVRPGTPKPTGSGRKRGSIDREQRKLLTDQLASDIWGVYKKLGKSWLMQLAQDRPDLFLNTCLARLLPPPQKDTEGDAPLVSLNFSGDPAEAARRIAFALAKGVAEQDREAEVEARVPYTYLEREIGPQEACRSPAPDPVYDQWARDASLSPEEKLNAETLDEHTNRRAFADSPPRPSWMPQEDRPERTPVRMRSKRDLL